MKNLAIIIGVEDKEEYLKTHKSDLKKCKKLEGVSVEVVKQCDQEEYRPCLHNDAAEYFLFFDEQVQLHADELKKLQALLAECTGDFYQQNVVKISVNSLGEKVQKKQNNLYFYLPSFVFGKAALKCIDLSGVPERLWQEKMLLDVTEKCGQAVLLEDLFLYTEAVIENDTSQYEPQFRKEWYLEDVKDFLIAYLEKRHPASKAVQKRIFNSLVMRFFMNLNEKEKFVLNRQELETFFEYARTLLKYIDDDVIAARKEYRKMPTSFTYIFFKEKYDGKLRMSVRNEEGKSRYYINDEWLESDFVSVRLEAFNYESDSIVINGEVRGDFFIDDIRKDFQVLLDGKSQVLEDDKSYNITKVFGQSAFRFYRFSVKLPMKSLKKRSTIEFQGKIQDGTVLKLPIELPKPAARLINNKWSYYAFADRMMVKNGNKLVIKHKRKWEIFVRECVLAKKAMKNQSMKTKFLLIGLRIAYWRTKKKYSNKKVWIFYDKLYKAGDNAEYMFAYSYQHAADVDSYYIVNKTSADYPRLKAKYGKHILEFESFRQRLVVLHADMIFATHAQVLKFCGFKGMLQKCFRHLLDAKVVCIQHGLTVQDIAQYQNKIKDNTSMYFCASKYEISNLKRPIYGYHGDELKLTGCPRYDGLVNNDQRQILITPTWRRNIVITGNKMGTAKQYNDQFKNTEYFRIYNTLINDPRLIETAKKNHYKLVYLLHPTLSSQAEDFDKNDSVEVVPATSDMSYEKILTESSLMLTDYSGVQFDFAYMKKPVLYYHPEELPPQYEETVYKYESMGFGPIITEYEKIVEELCEYMESGCKMKEKYQDRVDDFFAYTDHKNCERIYEFVK